MDLRALHLFAGAGGGILGGLLVGHVPVCAVEIDPFCQRVLLARQRDGLLPPFPIWDDVTTFDGHPWHGRVDVLHAGFPCQPWSPAGPRTGEADDRNLWPDTCRLVGEVRPRYVFLENVPALITHPYFGTILGHLATLGYDAVWTVLGADDVGAPHRRKRLWLLATDAEGERGRLRPGWGQPPGGAAAPDLTDDGPARHVADADQRGEQQPPVSGHVQRLRAGVCGQDVGHANGEQCQEQRQPLPARAAWAEPGCPGWWESEPGLDRVVNGLAHRVDRLRALGNGQVPLCAAVAWRVLLRASQPGH